MAKDRKGSSIHEQERFDEDSKSKANVEENADTYFHSERRYPSKHKRVQVNTPVPILNQPNTIRSVAKKKKSNRRSRKRRSTSYDSNSSSESDESDYSESDSGSEESGSEEERRRRRKRGRENEAERERKRRKKDKEKKKRRRKEKEQQKQKKKKENLEKGKKGPVTNSWGKYGIIRETDMW